MFSSPARLLTLAILCGGRSQRLGTDKGLYAPLGDEPLFVRALRLLAGDTGETLIVTKDADQARLYEQAAAQWLSADERAKVRIVSDTTAAPDSRPSVDAALTGVATALLLARTPAVVVVPVDQVGVRALHLRKLLAGAATASSAALPLAFGDAATSGGVLPFPSLWPTTLAPRVTSLLAGGALSVRGALRELGALPVDPEGLAAELAINGNTRDELRRYFGAPLHDPFGRRLHYLRLSLTEACNLSCTYCLPAGFPDWKRHKARLGLPEIAALLRGFRDLGFRKVRLTGGEPTVHPRCLDTVRLARQIGFETIAMTTNGLLLRDLTPWVDAGLTHLNVSLDSLDPARFHAVTGSSDAAVVRAVIENAAAAGLTVKVNTVLLRSRNGDAANIDALIDWALRLPVTLRFIELMETGLNGAFAAAERVLGTEIEPRLRARGLAPLAHGGRGPDLRGPATDFASDDWPGRIGLINPMSCNFCNKCNRLRVTAKGGLKLCLFGDQDLPLDLTSPAAVTLNVRRLIDRKPERHHLEDGNIGNVATFRTIGG